MIPRQAPERSATKPHLFQITIPGLSVKTAAGPVRARLLADFACIDDVLATTMPATLLIVYSGVERADEWLAAISDAVHRSSILAPPTDHRSACHVGPRPRAGATPAPANPRHPCSTAPHAPCRQRRPDRFRDMPSPR